MSINEEMEVRKGQEYDLPSEEEFDIVAVNGQKSPDLKKHFLNIAIIILIASASFGLGRFSFFKSNKVPVTIQYEKVGDLSQVSDSAPEVKGATATVNNQSDGTVVGSKNSTKYHYPWCSGAKNIAAANLITFTSIDEARKAGYTPAANCKGLK